MKEFVITRVSTADFIEIQDKSHKSHIIWKHELEFFYSLSEMRKLKLKKLGLSKNN